MYELACSRISPRASLPLLGGKDAETTKLNPISTRERSSDLSEDCAYDAIDIALIEVRIPASDTLNEFGPNHRRSRP
ncbi:hypothetical protein ACVIGB_005273 [Bradyrhizobium sp. USDA 4341]